MKKLYENTPEDLDWIESFIRTHEIDEEEPLIRMARMLRNTMYEQKIQSDINKLDFSNVHCKKFHTHTRNCLKVKKK